MISRTFALALGAIITSAVFAQSIDPAIAKIVNEGKNNSQVMQTLKDLTTIGPRLTGSPTLQRAEAWAVKKFKSYGLSNARLEAWGNVPVGFDRGPNQIGRMVSPYSEEIVFTTMNWTEGTKGLVRAEVVKAPSSLENVKLDPAFFKGKWVLVNEPVSMRGPAEDQQKAVREAMKAAQCAGLIFPARDERVHSSGTWRDKTYEKRPKGIEIVVRKSDYARMSRNVDFGRKPQVEFNIENNWFKGPFTQYNVIADIIGTEKPDEMVIICGHMDSWNTPGSTGTCDNATGVSSAIEAARILTRAGIKPKRTIRFILWSGEEQGLLGSRAYVQKHKADMPKIVAVLNDDGGTNYHGGYVGLAGMKSLMEKAYAPTVAAFPDMPMTFTTIARAPAGGSSDHAPFIWEGVPAFFTLETGRANYGRVWHTQFDQYQEAIPEYLVQSATNHAIVSYFLANSEETLPRFEKLQRSAVNLNRVDEQAVGADTIYYPTHIGKNPYNDDEHGYDEHEDDYILYLKSQFRWAAKDVLRGIRSR